MSDKPHSITLPSDGTTAGKTETRKKRTLKEKIIDILPWIFLFFTCAIAIASYIINFNTHGISNEPAQWAALGDYLGGILNPAISATALFFLMRAYYVQRDELADTRRALDSAARSSEASAKALDLQNQTHALNIRVNLISTKINFHQKTIEISNAEIAAVELEKQNYIKKYGNKIGSNDYLATFEEKKREYNDIILRHKQSIIKLGNEFDQISKSLYPKRN